jgi:hypothetical protein
LQLLTRRVGLLPLACRDDRVTHRPAASPADGTRTTSGSGDAVAYREMETRRRRRRLGRPADYLSLPPLDRDGVSADAATLPVAEAVRGAGQGRRAPCRPGRGATEVRYPLRKEALPPLEETYARAGTPPPRYAIRGQGGAVSHHRGGELWLA